MSEVPLYRAELCWVGEMREGGCATRWSIQSKYSHSIKMNLVEANKMNFVPYMTKCDSPFDHQMTLK